MYELSGPDCGLPRELPFSKVGDIAVASLSPRLWPAYVLELVEDSVLVRLSSNVPEEFEYAVDTVDALES